MSSKTATQLECSYSINLKVLPTCEFSSCIWRTSVLKHIFRCAPHGKEIQRSKSIIYKPVHRRSRLSGCSQYHCVHLQTLRWVVCL